MTLYLADASAVEYWRRADPSAKTRARAATPFGQDRETPPFSASDLAALEEAGVRMALRANPPPRARCVVAPSMQEDEAPRVLASITGAILRQAVAPRDGRLARAHLPVDRAVDAVPRCSSNSCTSSADDTACPTAEERRHRVATRNDRRRHRALRRQGSRSARSRRREAGLALRVRQLAVADGDRHRGNHGIRSAHGRLRPGETAAEPAFRSDEEKPPCAAAIGVPSRSVLAPREHLRGIRQRQAPSRRPKGLRGRHPAQRHRAPGHAGRDPSLGDKLETTTNSNASRCWWPAPWARSSDRAGTHGQTVASSSTAYWCSDRRSERYERQPPPPLSPAPLAQRTETETGTSP